MISISRVASVKFTSVTCPSDILTPRHRQIGSVAVSVRMS